VTSCPDVIRDADPARDAGACLAIYAPFVTGSAVSFEEQVPSEAEMARRIAGAHAWLVAEDEGATVGYAYGSRHRERAAYRWAADVAVYVDASARHAGLGRELYARLFERMRDLGYWTLCAGVAQPNVASDGLHRALGFGDVGTYRRIGWKGGAWHDVRWWQLELRPDDTAPPAEPAVARAPAAAPPSAERPARGGCLCGAVRYEISLPFRRANVCHCSRCRKHSGSVGLVQGRVPREGFALRSGADHIEVFHSHEGMAKAFCRRCGSSLFGGTWPGGPEVSIRLGTLDDDPGIRPQYHSFTADVPAWDLIPDDGLPRYPQGPPGRGQARRPEASSETPGSSSPPAVS
jgi:L-amino acid N-acyltransferase YncA